MRILIGLLVLLSVCFQSCESHKRMTNRAEYSAFKSTRNMKGRSGAADHFRSTVKRKGFGLTGDAFTKRVDGRPVKKKKMYNKVNARSLKRIESGGSNVGRKSKSYKKSARASNSRKGKYKKSGFGKRQGRSKRSGKSTKNKKRNTKKRYNRKGLFK